MVDLKATTKRLQINRANTTIVIGVAIAAFVVTFSLVASRSLWSQRGYKSRVIKAKTEARDQLKENISVADSLTSTYKDFIGKPDNILGGNPTGGGERDGDNGEIVLDALPSKYNYPALVSSLEKLVGGPNYAIKSITGADDSLVQVESQSTNPVPVPMPFDITVEGNFASLKDLMGLLERSIRPISVVKLDLNGTAEDKVEIVLHANSYYQPEKTLKITTKEVK